MNKDRRRERSSVARPLRQRTALAGLDSRAVVVAALLALCVASTATAQQELLPEPASSPIWWTLSDAVSSEDLKTRHTDLARQRDAFNTAASASSFPLPEDRRPPADEITRYYDPASEPEMMPMWFAFQVLALHLVDQPGETERRLSQTALSESGRQAVVDHLVRFDRRVAEWQAALAVDSAKFLELMRDAMKATGSRAQRAALYEQWWSGELSTLTSPAAEQGFSEQRLEQLHAAWRARPDLEAARLLLPTLRSSLSDQDWAELRRFLLEAVVPTIGSFMETLPYD